MKSVEVTRVIPSRCAASVAIVDLPGPRRAADEQDDRDVELPQRVEPTQPPHRAAALGLAQHLRRELAEPVEVDAVGAARREVGVGTTGELVRARDRQPGRGERAGHQALRPRRAVVAAERQRSEIAPLAHRTTSGATRHGLRREPLELVVERRLARDRHDVVRGQDDRTPRRCASSATTSIAAAFSSTTKTSASVRVEVACGAAARSARLPETLRHVRAVRLLEVRREPSVLGLRRGAEERDPLAGDRLERPRPKDRADDRNGRRRRVRAAPSRSAAWGASDSAIVTTTRSAIRARYALR